MALTATKPLELGFEAPAFELNDVVTGKACTPESELGEHGLLVMFICNHCPYVVHVREELIALGEEYLPKGIGMVAISSNDVSTHPQDGPEHMKALAEELDFPFPYCFDESQEVARAYHAECTPDFALFDAELKCVYRGRLDDSTPGNDKPVTGKDMRAVFDALIAGEAIAEDQPPSMGCNIKWKG